jgi:site-specific recombinase XerD
MPTQTSSSLNKRGVLPPVDTLLQLHSWKFIKFSENNGITGPEGITVINIRTYLSTMVEYGLSDSYIHGHTRAIRTLIRFWHTEKYILERISCQMPTIAKKRLPVQSAEEVRQIISVCQLPEIKPLCFLWSISGRSMRFKLGRCV